MRPKTESQRKLGFPSLAICYNAARATSIIVETQLSRDEYSVLLCQAPVLLMSAVVILFDMWEKGRGVGHAGQQLEIHKADVQRCMDCLSTFEQRWRPAGKFL